MYECLKCVNLLPCFPKLLHIARYGVVVSLYKLLQYVDIAVNCCRDVIIDKYLPGLSIFKLTMYAPLDGIHTLMNRDKMTKKI